MTRQMRLAKAAFEAYYRPENLKWDQHLSNERWVKAAAAVEAEVTQPVVPFEARMRAVWLGDDSVEPEWGRAFTQDHWRRTLAFVLDNLDELQELKAGAHDAEGDVS